MTDIAPGLLERLQVAFKKNLSSSVAGKTLLERIRSGKGTYEDAGNYADVLGTALSDALTELSPEELPNGQMYWNIADRVLRPLLESDYDLAAQAARMVQDALNQTAGIGIKAKVAQLPEGRVDGILNMVCSGPFEDTRWILAEPLQTFCRAAVDDTLKANLDFQSKAGLSPRIIRRTSGRKCCEVCSRLAGTYNYPEDTPRNMNPSVFWRHNSCRCVVEYDPDGSGIRQNVHTKKWTTAEERAILEERKQIGLDGGYTLTPQERLSKKKLKSGFSAFPDGDVLNRYITRVKPKEGFYDVAMHGTPTMVCFGSQSTNMTARQLAAYLRHQDGYHGEAIRLLSCSTGKQIDGGYCFAEELANALGVEVEAPNKKLYIYENGALSVGAAGDGSFVLYRPNERRRLS